MSDRPFITPESVYSGSGVLEVLAPAMKDSGAARVLVVTDRGVSEAGTTDLLVSCLGRYSLTAVVFDATRPEPGLEAVDEAVRRGSSNGGVDAVVGLGGGSPMDVAKVASVILKHGGAPRDYLGTDKVRGAGLPLALVPTTAGTGSEATPNALFVVDGEKREVVSRYLIPKIAVIDADLTLSAPSRITASSGIDALVHACESYTSVAATPLSEMYSLRAVELIATSLRTAVWQGTDRSARADMSLGSLMAGVAIANAGTGAVHALAYPLGGKYGIPHGISNALMFPYVAEWNAVSNVSRFATLAKAMGERIDGLSIRQAAFLFAESVKTIVEDVGLPTTLAEVGIGSEELDYLAHSAAQQTRLLRNNPRRLSLDDISLIYRRAMNPL